MQDKPVIKTAIPRRRYQIGDFTASLLAEIESADAHHYRYILAFVQLGHSEPAMYVCAEAADQGQYRLRVINQVMAEAVDTSQRWGDLDAFAEQGLKLGAQALGLQREQVVRLL